MKKLRFCVVTLIVLSIIFSVPIFVSGRVVEIMPPSTTTTTTTVNLNLSGGYNIFDQELNTTSNVTFDGIKALDWSNITGGEFLYNQTASAYFYNMTPSPYFYNQTASPYFYNQTASVYFYNMSDGNSGDTGENLTLSGNLSVTGNATFMDRLAIGVASASYKLHVAGTGYFTGSVYPNFLYVLSGGTEGSPSYSFNGDTNSGMWSVAGDILGFSTNAKKRLEISNNELRATGTGNFSGAVYVDNGTLVNEYIYNQTASPYFYNQTDSIYFYNMTVIGAGGSYNETYVVWAYNQTESAYWYNMTPSIYFYNQTFIGDYNYNQTDSIYFYNMTVIGSGLSNSSAGVTLNFTTLSSYDWSNITNGEYLYNQTASAYWYNMTPSAYFYNMTPSAYFYNQTASPYFYNQTASVYFYNMTVIGSGLSNSSAGVTLNFTTLASYDWSNISGEFWYNQTASPYFYNQTASIYFYNMTVIGSGVANNSVGVNINFTTLASYDWSNITGYEFLYNQTASAYWYNMTPSAYFYNQTASPYFYNQTASIYFYNMTVIGSGINNNSAGINLSFSDLVSYNWANITGYEFIYNHTANQYFYNMTPSIYFYNQTFIGDYNYNQTDTIYFYNMSDGNTGAVNIFDQNLNTTESVVFSNVSVSMNISVVGNVSIGNCIIFASGGKICSG